MHITSEMLHIVDDFDRQGFAVLPNFIESDCLQRVKEGCQQLVDNLAEQLYGDGVIGELYSTEPFARRMICLFASHLDKTPTIFRPELHLPAFYDLFAHPKLLDLAELVLGAEIRLYPNYSVRPKLPNDPRTEVLWHQDAGYTNTAADALRMMNVWVPLVPANEENGCMQFIPESHRLGVVGHQKEEFYLQIDQEYLAPRMYSAIQIETMPGDAVIFSNLLFHRGLPNRSNHIRWSVDFRYQDATQSTMRTTEGHLLCSKISPEQVVRNRDHWGQLSFK